MFNLLSVIFLIFGLVKSLRHHIEKQFKLIPLNLDIRTEHRIDILLLCYVAITKLIRSGKCLLQSDFLVGERDIPDVLYDFLGTFQRQDFEIFDFLSKVLLHEVHLDGAGLVRIQLVEDLLNLLIMEKDMRRVRV